MIYSCFNQQTGLYDYFEDTLKRPINADLPIPKLPPSTGRIGVPSIEAGRPLPADAVHRGRGWHARGMVVQCNQRGLGQASEPSNMEGTPKEAWEWTKAGGWKWIAGAALVIWVARRL